jgi:Divergent InlB B-repeat domain
MNTKYLIILAGMLSAATVLQAATRYVATTGSDTTGNGSITNQYKTIQKAVDVSAAGDVILVAPGTYATGEDAANVSNYGRSRVAITKNITVRSLQGAEQTIIRGQANSSTNVYGPGSIRCVLMTSGTLDGFTLINGYANARAPVCGVDVPLVNGGGLCVATGTNSVVNNCIITGCGAYAGGGVYRGTLNNCTVAKNSSYAGSSAAAVGVWCSTVRNSIVRLNTPNDFSSPSNTVDTSTFAYCCLPSIPGQNINRLSRNLGGNITADPLFQAGTLIPARNSPCIDKGSNAYAFGTMDAAGLSRIFNVVDIGAYEVRFLPYTLTVVNGQGSGTYTNGDVVSILFTNTQPRWVTFTGWTGDTNTVADVTASATTLVMPARAATVSAGYQISSTIPGIIREVLDIPLPIATSNVTIFSVNPDVPSVTLGGIADGDRAYFETVYTNAGTVIFSWNVSSEEGYDFLNFYVDGALKARISGEVSGVVTQFVANIGSGLTNEAHRLRWEYSKDESYFEYDDQGEVGPILWIPNDLAAELGFAGTNNSPSPIYFPYGKPGVMLPFPYGFEGCYLDRNPPTNAVAGKAVKIGGLVNGVPFIPNSQSNGVEAVLNGAGTLTFRCYTDCQADDKLVCTVDGVSRFSWAANKNKAWSNVVIAVTGNVPHVVRWTYLKGAVSWQSGLDAVWIDNVTWARQTCTLSVQGGSGSGTYYVGDIATIIATNVTATQVFEKWTGNVTHVANVNSMTTTVFMAASTVVSANYKVKYNLTVTAGSGSGSYFGGQVIPVAALVPTGMVFDAWSGDTEYLDNRTSATTTFFMPERAVAITAIFKVAPYLVSVVNGWEGGSLPNAAHEGYGDPQGVYPPGAAVRIIANPAPLWKTFDRWTASPVVSISNATADITTFIMPSNSVALTANYRDQTIQEKLAAALTIRGQPLVVTQVSSTNGVVALSAGGVRYNDTVVKFGGPSVGPNQNVSLTTTNFVGDGTLLFWWRGDTEADADGIAVEVNGTAISPTYSEKSTNTLDHTLWYLNAFTVTNANSVTFRYSRDDSYMVHDNFMLMDRVTWIPKAVTDNLETRNFPNINQEFDPCFNGHVKTADGLHAFSGEDGGVKWDAAESAIKIGHFGYVTNNQIAQVGFAFNKYSVKPAGGIYIWEWKTKSESNYDRLELLLDLMPTNWISGKNTGWVTNTFVIKKEYDRGATASPITDPDVTWPVLGFRYKKDQDQSFLDDAGWVRNGKWYPTYIVDVGDYGTNTILTLPNPLMITNAVVKSEIDKGVIPAGTVMRIQARIPAGNVFTGWTGDYGGVIDPWVASQIVTNLEQNIDINATYRLISSPSPAPLIKGFSISETPLDSSLTGGLFAAPASGVSKSIAMTFEGPTLVGLSVEWSSSLANPKWTALDISKSEVLQQLPNGVKLWKLHAQAPSGSTQGFFRLK